MENQKFDLGTVLTITTGVLLTEICNVYKILDYMTGDHLFTHQIPRVGRECEPIILEQYPQLASVNIENVTANNWKEFLDEQIAKFGNEFEIIPVGLFEHKHIDAIEELKTIIGESKTILLT